MNSNLTRGIATFSMIVAIMAGSVLLAQEPTERSTSKPQQEPGLEKIGDAYRTLQGATLKTLQEKARNWPKPVGSSSNSGSETGSTANLSPDPVREEELLIAACPHGLLAGAPTGSALSKSGMSTTRPRDPTPSDPNAKREGAEERAANPSTGILIDQQVGLFLVCSHETSPSSSTSTSPEGSQNATESARSRINAPLQPGIYCVKMTGNSVWLADQNGVVVLRTMVDPETKGLSNASSSSSSSEAARERDRIRASEEKPAGSVERDRTFGVGSSKEELNWGCVFGAIIKEAMTSTRWEKNN
jgi:hypothetical protein